MDTRSPMPRVDATLHDERLPTHRIRPLYRSTQIVWYILGIVEILLGFRFLLKLFGANSAAGFTRFISSATWPFAQPFLYVFRQDRIGTSIFEWTTLLAMAVYFLVAWLIVRALVMAKPVSTAEADAKLPEQE